MNHQIILLITCIAIYNSHLVSSLDNKLLTKLTAAEKALEKAETPAAQYYAQDKLETIRSQIAVQQATEILRKRQTRNDH